MWLVHRKGVFVHRRLAVFGNSRGRSSSVFGLYFDHKELLLPVVIRTVFSRHEKGARFLGCLAQMKPANLSTRRFHVRSWTTRFELYPFLLSSRRAARVKTLIA